MSYQRTTGGGAISRRSLLKGAAGALAAASLGALAPSAALAAGRHHPVRARRADDVVESIGLSGIHFEQPNSPYVTQYEAVEEKVHALKVRYARNRVMEPPEGRALQLRLHRNTGVRFLLNTPHNGQVLADLDSVMEALRTGYEDGSIFLALEGPNEFDRGDPARAAAVLAYQRDFYDQVKADRSLSHLPVLGPSVAHAERYELFGDLRSMSDAASMHAYPTVGLPPESGLLETWMDSADESHRRQPLWNTETGYHTGTGRPAPQTGTPELVQAKYLPRLLMYNVLQPRIPYVFKYELIDSSTSPTAQLWGLLRRDLTEKPSYHALKNLVDLFRDPGARFRPGALDYELYGDLRDIHQVLLQKADGTFYLVVWQGVRNWDPATQEELTYRDRRLLLRVRTPIAKARLYEPAPPPVGAGTTPIRTYHYPNHPIRLDVPDQLLIVELVPERKQD